MDVKHDLLHYVMAVTASTNYTIYNTVPFLVNGTVSAKIAPRLKCYKNVSR